MEGLGRVRKTLEILGVAKNQNNQIMESMNDLIDFMRGIYVPSDVSEKLIALEKMLEDSNTNHDVPLSVILSPDYQTVTLAEGIQYIKNLRDTDVNGYVGVTGAPGVGKSEFLESFVSEDGIKTYDEFWADSLNFASKIEDSAHAVMEGNMAVIAAPELMDDITDTRVHIISPFDYRKENRERRKDSWKGDVRFLKIPEVYKTFEKIYYDLWRVGAQMVIRAG